MVQITEEDVSAAVCFSGNALGNGTFTDMADIVQVKPAAFDPARTVDIAAEISRVNRALAADGRRYLLIGPGRWGSADRHLGIPVAWQDISGVGAIIEAAADNLQADPSYGSHFFHNITSLGISYITIARHREDFLDEPWLDRLPARQETKFLKVIRLDSPLTIKVDGKTSRATILK